ncbi:MAG: alpha-amylase family glycosyl hydrolase [Polyangiaceae bacterium]|nr:alpha-amylase family glycosyl hydrolase [Polyangiaceae bacterium]
MHARKIARDAYFPKRDDDSFFAPRGDITFADTAVARVFADRVNIQDGRSGEAFLRPAELAAMVLVHEIFHVVIGLYRQRHPASFDRLIAKLDAALTGSARETVLAFLHAFPTPAIYRHIRGEGDETPEKLLAREGRKAEDTYAEEVLLLWLVNQNPAYEPVRSIVSDRDLGQSYQAFVLEARNFFASEAPFGPRGQSLIDLLLEPSRRRPTSILDQLKFIEEEWGQSLGLDQLDIWRRMLWVHDFLSEEGKYFYRGGPGPGSPLLDAMRFDRTEVEPKAFSPDLDWMPRVVLIAKTVYVWLDQLSKQYGRSIERLDEIPDEELDLLASRGFSALWLIGLFERSSASKKIKQMRGDSDAVASAYSLRSYAIAWELGGFTAYENLKQRAWQRGIRLAADMVPNHVGIDADWVVNHPDWFLQTNYPPFPSYRFGGPDLSEDDRVGVFLEEGYWSKTDAAVVFRRHDRHTGQDRFFYHGNDGTSMPWNDTAQLDYTKPEVRRAIIETILHVARMFPIIRFDAAMTLAKRHFQRLWFPLPGAGGAIPSRSDHALTQEEFDRKIPVEFWREVVDTVARRAPDTLLLAEAFWMMEGYFVRSLGMHRVYNSAFMNMLKREENQKYRETIKNVLDYEPQILKRFVNFMNNPDEETAAVQFGGDDKYFGVCVLMCTMPGLPMFGHGQIEGFHEKYGMEYRRAKWDERPNDGLIARHEREIFPILKKRYIFSGVDQFALYDFVAEGGGVDEDVYAYSNQAGDERAIVLYNNKYKTTRGRIHASHPSLGEDGHTRVTRISDVLGIAGKNDGWLRFRDIAQGLEYLRPIREVDGGFFWELGAFKYHVLMGFRTMVVTTQEPWDKLAEALGGRGVPSLDKALVEFRFLPVHRPLSQALSREHVEYLLSGWDEKKRNVTSDAHAALAERLGHFADGLEYVLGVAVMPDARKRVLARAQERFEVVMTMVHAAPEDLRARDATEHVGSAKNAKVATSQSRKASASRANTPATDVDDAKPEVAASELVRWVEVRAAVELIQAAEATTKTSSEIVAAWELPLVVMTALEQTQGSYDVQLRAALVLLATTLPEVSVCEAMHAALSDARGKAFLGMHDAGGVTWLVKERFDELATMLALRNTALGLTSLALARRQAKDVSAVAEREGYRAVLIEEALSTNRPL